jgi:hypothetical protein
MNLDAVSIALAQISFTLKTLSKKNFKNSLAEISNVYFFEKSFSLLLNSYF